MGRRAVVVGAGIGGLAAALALHRRGWSVEILERAERLAPVGTTVAMAPNALRALDTLDAGDELRALAISPGASYIRKPDGRPLMPLHAEAAARRVGEPIVIVHRWQLLDALSRRLPTGMVRLGSSTVGVEPGDSQRSAVVRTEKGELEAELVVVADGVRSTLRAALFPNHPGPRYTGLTSWHFVIDSPPGRRLDLGETWGAGTLFGIIPLADGRVYGYGYARAPATPRTASSDERAQLVERFGTWHDPIPQLVNAVPPEAVLRHDVYDLGSPVPTYNLGRVAILGDAAHAMSPNLGQGGCQALEDAVVLDHVVADVSATDLPGALAAYTAARLPRTKAVMRQAQRALALIRWSSPWAVGFRDVAFRLAGRLSPEAALRPLADIVSWHPPTTQARRTPPGAS